MLYLCRLSTFPLWEQEPLKHGQEEEAMESGTIL
jgi:hypothetical protein